MNSKEFLKLIERRPLPWGYESQPPSDDFQTPAQHWNVDCDGDPIGATEHGLAWDLAQDAPGMAAAILKFLQVPWQDRTTGDVAALRASLPESLR